MTDVLRHHNDGKITRNHAVVAMADIGIEALLQPA